MTSETCLLLNRIENGDCDAMARLLPVVYTELRRLAVHYMRGEAPDHTLQPTALVHEAYMRLVGQEKIGLQGRTHFIGMAALSMRRILVESARRRCAAKRGGKEKSEPLTDLMAYSAEKPAALVALDEALTRLALLSPRQARVVELRFFAGRSVDEIAEMEGVSTRTVKSEWSVARAWLHREIVRAD